MLKFFKTGFQKITSVLRKTSRLLRKTILSLLSQGIDDNVLAQLEKTLYQADLGSKTVEEFLETIRHHHKASPEELLTLLEEKAVEILRAPPQVVGNEPLANTPLLILIVGVNGSGKTTTLAKLAKHYQSEGKKVLLAAGDTFRAAAQEQIEVWAKRLSLDLVKGSIGGDPSSVLFDALTKAKAKQYDIVLADTAGRLESKTELMRELEKMRRTAQKQDVLAPHETFLVIDATLGQTAIDQARIFNTYTPLTGLILTKIDGSAKGGVALAIYRELGIPIRFLGSGETVDDLIAFDAKAYAEALFHE